MRINCTIIFLIIAAYAINALQDGINFSKCAKAEDLKILWHAAKYLHIGFTFGAGMFTFRESKYGLFGTVISILLGILLGSVTWYLTYPIYRSIDWPDWA